MRGGKDGEGRTCGDQRIAVKSCSHPLRHGLSHGLLHFIPWDSWSVKQVDPPVPVPNFPCRSARGTDG